MLIREITYHGYLTPIQIIKHQNVNQNQITNISDTLSNMLCYVDLNIDDVMTKNKTTSKFDRETLLTDSQYK